MPDHRRVDLLHYLARRADQCLAEPRRVQRAAVGQGGVGVGELQRRDGHVALADRGDRRLARLPDPAVLAVLPLDLLHVRAVLPAVLAPVLALVRVVLPHPVEPLAGRDRAGGLFGQVDARVLAEAPVELHLLHLLRGRLGAEHVVRRPVVALVHLVAEVVVNGVAGLDQRLGERHVAQAWLAVVDERGPVDVHRRRAGVKPVQREAVGDRRGGRGDLERRARRVLALGRPVQRRLAGAGLAAEAEQVVDLML